MHFGEGEDQAAPLLQPVGGMDQIARAFEAQVSGDLITDAQVTEIRKITDGVREKRRFPRVAERFPVRFKVINAQTSI